MADRLSIVNAALADIGDYPMEFESEEAAAEFTADGTIDPEDDTQRLVGSLYPQVKNTLLNAHPWSWLTARDMLVLSPAQGRDNIDAWPYRHRYQQPRQRIGNIRAVFDRAETDAVRVDGWVVQGAFIFASFNPAWIEYQRDVGEEAYPDLFVNALTLALTARLSFARTQDLDTLRVYERLAEAALNDASRVDGQSHPTFSLQKFDFIDARVGLDSFYTRSGRV